jgi:hypothetical protein
LHLERGQQWVGNHERLADRLQHRVGFDAPQLAGDLELAADLVHARKADGLHVTGRRVDCLQHAPLANRHAVQARPLLLVLRRRHALLIATVDDRHLVRAEQA